MRSNNRAALAPAGGSLLQFFLASFPLLVVLTYFLYLAFRRPSLNQYNYSEDDYDDVAFLDSLIDADGPQIRLMEMLGVFLFFLIIWSSLALYLVVFVPKRRNLMRRYLLEGMEVLGNVRFDERHSVCGAACSCCCCGCLQGRTDYAYVTYNHPGAKELANDREAAKSDLLREAVSRRVRTYHPYDRESVSILVLPDWPLSGQPRRDVEVDVATYSDGRGDLRDRTNSIVNVCYFWIIFLSLGSLFLVYQQYVIEDETDDFRTGAFILLAVLCVGIPVVCFGGNYIRWIIHRRWIINTGRVTEHSPTDPSLPVLSVPMTRTLPSPARPSEPAPDNPPENQIPPHESENPTPLKSDDRVVTNDIISALAAEDQDTVDDAFDDGMTRTATTLCGGTEDVLDDIDTNTAAPPPPTSRASVQQSSVARTESPVAFVLNGNGDNGETIYVKMT